MRSVLGPVAVATALLMPLHCFSAENGATAAPPRPPSASEKFHLSDGQTLSGSELLIDEQTPLDGRPTRLAVKVRPVVQAGGGVILESDWDLALDLGSVRGAPVRMQRRVKTRSHLKPGEETTISRVVVR
jgi:hypothetical protein